MAQPDFNLLIPLEYEQGGQRKTRWVKFGTVWANRDGTGYSGKVDFWPTGAGNRVSMLPPKETANGDSGQ
jgi:hypothetical protein